MILVLAGTLDGRELAVKLAAMGQPVIVSVISDYGRNLAEAPGVRVQVGPLTFEDMKKLIGDRGIKVLVDASHPYAVNGSVNAMAACEATGIQYIRYERAEVNVPAEYSRLHTAGDAGAAANIAAGLGRVIFLTTGSRTLGLFKNEPSLASCRLIARVLPQPAVIAECIELGFSPADIIAIQGPFSHCFNAAMFKEYGAEVIITKNSGNIGGADTKISAAVELNLPVIVIGRPAVAYKNLCLTRQEVINMVLEVI